MPGRLPYLTKFDPSLLDAINDGSQREYLFNHGVHGLDGPWSKESQNLKARFNTRGFHFNRWWLLTSPDWWCSVCKREKSEIARKDKNSLLSGHLHEHHDHMTDVVERLFAEISANREEVVATEHGKKFIQKIASSISAYDPTIICSDCNAADAAAKKMIGAPKDFSFSPSEIGNFIDVLPSEAHQVDEVSAREIWKQQAATFQSRMNFARQLAQVAAENQHWYQSTERRDLPDNIERVAKHHLMAAAGVKNEQVDVSEYLAAFPLPSSYADLTKWRKRWKSGLEPTDGDIAHLAAVTSYSHWSSVANDWKCPCCGRQKKETVHKNNKGEWSFSVRTSSWYSEDGQMIEVVCNDCYTASINLAKEINVSRSDFKLVEIASVIHAGVYQRHSFVTDGDIGDMLSKVKQRMFDRWEDEL